MKAYVYHITVDGVVRYVGKGTGNRASSHIRIVQSIMRRRAAGETVKASHFHNRLAKAYRNGANIQIEIVVDGLTDEAAFVIEIEQIASHKYLWNKTPGGEAPPRATRRSPEFVAKVTASNVITWSDPRLKSEQSKRMKELWQRDDYRVATIKKRGRSVNGSGAANKRWSDPEYRAKMKKTHDDPAFKLRRSEATKRGWETRRAIVK